MAAEIRNASFDEPLDCTMMPASHGAATPDRLPMPFWMLVQRPAIQGPASVALRAAQDKPRQPCSLRTEKESPLPVSAVRIVADPPVPRKLVNMPLLASHYEADGNDKRHTPAGAFCGTVGAVAICLAGIVGPEFDRSDTVAGGTLQPLRKANSDETPEIGILILAALFDNRRQSKPLYAELLLQTGFSYRLHVR